MILSTVPDMVRLGFSGIRAVSRFSSAILADLAMRGFAISFLTLARVAWPDSLLACLCTMDPLCHRRGNRAVSFRTPPTSRESSGLGLCAERGIHSGTKGANWVIGILNPRSLGFEGGHNVWIWNHRNYRYCLRSCLALEESVRADSPRQWWFQPPRAFNYLPRWHSTV